MTSKQSFLIKKLSRKSNSANDLPIPLVAPMIIAFFIFIKVDKLSMNVNFLKFDTKFNPSIF
jgi:hypothetical protein